MQTRPLIRASRAGFPLKTLAAATALGLGAALFVPQIQSAHATSEVPVVQGLPNFTPLVDLVGPSVVNIRTLEKVKVGGQGNGMPPEMLEFFRRFGMPIPPGFGQQNPHGKGGGQEEARPRGVGSGFVLSADGYILTNAHVVEDADELIVTLPDEREFKAKVVGADKRTDVALVKIDAEGLQPVSIGDANALRVGEWVMAIGSPYGLENTVTAGIVSAKQRETGDYLPFIQTDVAINPGNSGGPLINMNGQVVGINSQIYSRSGGFQGISFAIPIDEAMRVSDQLRSQGFVTRGRIGVSIDEVTKEVAEATGLGKPRGALVRGVERGSPADQAGIEPGDVILSFGGKEVDEVPDLPRLVGNTKPGSEASMTVWRQGKEKTLDITVGQFEREDKVAVNEKPSEPDASGVLQDMGLSVRDLTQAEREELGLPGGVFVASAEGIMGQAGLRSEDVILAVDQQKISSVEGLKKVLAALDKRDSFNVLYRRGDWVQYAMVRR